MGGPVIVTGLPASVAVVVNGCSGTRSPSKGTLAVSPGTGNGTDNVCSPLRNALATSAGASTNAAIAASGSPVRTALKIAVLLDEAASAALTGAPKASMARSSGELNPTANDGGFTEVTDSDAGTIRSWKRLA